jgi:hypothetical protein
MSHIISTHVHSDIPKASKCLPGDNKQPVLDKQNLMPSPNETLQSDLVTIGNENDEGNVDTDDSLGSWPPLMPSHTSKPVYQQRVVTNSQYQNHKQPDFGPVKKGKGGSNAGARGNSVVGAQSQVRARTQERMVVGQGTAPGLQAAKRSHHKPPQSNRICRGVFVTSLHPKTTAQQGEKYIKRETGRQVPVEKLHTRYSSYSSFFIRCEQPIRNELLSPYLWPEDTKVKLYHS